MKTNILLVFALFMLFTACESNDLDVELSVYTEEVVFTSGEKVIMTGRILSSENFNVSDHGFHISENEDFTDSKSISLGERTIPGRFVGELEGLSIHLDYYCRAYIIENGTEKIGNVLQFSTLSPRIVDFAPKEGTQNNRIIFEGVNLTSDAIILWNDQTITPNEITEESFLEITVPAPVDLPYAEIKVVMQGDTVVIEDRFEYIIGGWEDSGMIDDPVENHNHIYFEDNDYFYYGLGVSREINAPISNIYRVNKTTLERDEINHDGLESEGSFFTTNGYFGGGSLFFVLDPDPTLLNISQFFKLDGDKTRLLKNVPALLYKAVAFAHEDYIYLYGGEDSGRARNTNIYRYDIQNDNWDNIGDSPYGPLNEYPHFKIGSKNYFINETGQMMSHDVNSDIWETLANYPEEVEKDGINVVLNDLAYVGLQDISRRVFEYLPSEDRWKQKKRNPNQEQSKTLGSWINDNKITIMRTDSQDGESRFFWTFDPFSL